MRQLTLLLLLFLPITAQAIVINEIMYNPDQCSDADCEWVELYNNDIDSINLAGWKLDGKNISGIIEANNYLIVAKDNTSFTEYFNTSCPVVKASISLTNSEKNLYLNDSGNNVIDNVFYAASWGADGNNKTLSLAGNSWRESLQASGTPCAQNFFEHSLKINLEKTDSDEITAHITNNGLNDENVTMDFYIDGNYSDTQNGFVASFGSDNFYFPINDTEIGNHTVFVNASFGAFSETAELNFTIEPLPNADVYAAIIINETSNEYIIRTFPANATVFVYIGAYATGIDNTPLILDVPALGEDFAGTNEWEGHDIITEEIDFGSYDLCAEIAEIDNYNDTNLENNFVCANFTIAPEGTKKRIKTFATKENYELNETLNWAAQIFPQSSATGDLTITMQKKNSPNTITLFEQNDFELSENVTLSGNITIPDDRVEGIYKIRAKFSYSGTYIDSGDSGQFWLAGLKDLGPANFTVLQLPDSVSFGGFKTIFVKFFSGNYNYGKLKFLVYGYPKQVLADTEGQGISASDFDSDVAIELDNVRRGQEIYIALPAFAKQNCGNDYDSAGKPITTADTDLQLSGSSSFCSSGSSSSKASGKTTALGLAAPKQKIELISVSIADIPAETATSSDFTIRAKIKNNLNSSKQVEVYSYVYQSKTIISEGGWTANKQTVYLDSADEKTIELENRVKAGVALGKYDVKVRVKDGAKNYDADAEIKVVEQSSSQKVNAGVGNAITGSAVYVSKTSTINPVLGLFVFLLLVLVLVLIKSK